MWNHTEREFELISKRTKKERFCKIACVPIRLIGFSTFVGKCKMYASEMIFTDLFRRRLSFAWKGTQSHKHNGSMQYRGTMYKE